MFVVIVAVAGFDAHTVCCLCGFFFFVAPTLRRSAPPQLWERVSRNFHGDLRVFHAWEKRIRRRGSHGTVRVPFGHGTFLRVCAHFCTRLRACVRARTRGSHSNQKRVASRKTLEPLSVVRVIGVFTHTVLRREARETFQNSKYECRRYF